MNSSFNDGRRPQPDFDAWSGIPFKDLQCGEYEGGEDGMFQNIIENMNYYFWFTLGGTLFLGMCFAGAIYGLFVNTKEMENEKLKKCLRIAATVLIVCFWLWGGCYKLLYPISLAKYEYDHDICITETGIVNNVKREGNAHSTVTIDNVAYTVVYFGTDKPWKQLEKQLKKGDSVSFQYGENSRYIFIISKQDQEPES